MSGSPRRRAARWALALVSAVSLGSLGLVAVASAPAQAAVTPIATGPGLDWGVKASWRTYIGEGGTTLADGATRNEDGTFHFPVAVGSYDDATRTTVLELDGSVEFLGHCHGVGGAYARPCDLDLTFSDVRVEISEDRASLFVDAASRPIAGGEVVTYDDVALVDLDVEDIDPVVAGGVTRWPALTATMTAEGERIFNYPAGTVVDPVAFGYDGPGGRPVGETWDVAGQTVHEAVATDPQPSATPGRVVGRLSGGELVGWNGGAAVAVLDPDTLAPLSPWVSGPGVTGAIVRDSIAIDPATDTIFASTSTTNLNDRRLVTFRWDGTALTATEVAGSHAPDLVADGGGGATWDQANDRYVIARTRSATATDLWEVVDLAGTWTARKLGPVTLSSTGGSAYENAIVNLVAVPDGPGRTVFLATSLFGGRPLQRIAAVGAGFRGEPLAETGDLQPDRLLRTRNGVYVIAAFDQALFLPLVGYADGRRLGAATEPVSFQVALDANRNAGMLVADWASDTLVGVTDSSRNLTRLQRGELVSRGALTTGPYGGGSVVGIHADGAIWGVRDGLLQKVRAAGESPAFAEQPEAPVADLRDATAPITLSAVVTGTPAPALTWQTRIPGQPWAEVTEGADGAALTATVSAADLGRQYRLVAQNAAGRVASDRVTLALRTPPRIMVQPTDVAVAPGETVELKVMPEGSPAPDIRWQQRIGGVWHDVPGQDAATLRLEDVDTSLSGTAFRARLSNPVGSVVSDRVTVTVAAPSTDPREITGGTVDWGVKASFRSYIGGPIAHGSITAEGGVAVNDDGSFAFPVVDGAWDPSGTSTVELGGSVHFTGHDAGAGPQLDLRITDPRLVIGADGSTLVADVVSRGLASGELATYDDVVLADLATTDRVRALGDTLTVAAVPASLTAAGAPAFADFYPADTELDPIDGTIELGAVIEDPGTGPEPVGTTTGLLVGGATPYGQEVGVQVAVRATDRRTVDGTVQLGLGGRTWTAPVVDGVATTSVPAGTAPGAHRLEARFLGADGLQASSGVGWVQIAKATPAVRVTLPKKRVSRTARAKLTVVASLPGSPLPVTGRVVVRVDGKVVERGPLAPNVRGRTVLRLPRLAAGTHRVTVTVTADPRFRAATSKAVVVRVR